MTRKVVRIFARVAGFGLIVLVLWIVGWADRVTSIDGEEFEGEILTRSDTRVELREADGSLHGIVIEGPEAVRIGLRSAFRPLKERPSYALVGILLHLIAVLVTYYRWGVLLRGAGLATPWRTVVRLAWVGQFIGAALPGGIGSGDLVKAFYVAREHQGRKARSVVTVFVDRAVGLFVLCVIALVAVFFAPPETRLATARNVLLVLFGIGFLGFVLLLSERFRDALRLRRLVDRLPFQHVVHEVSESMRIYGARKRPVAGAALVSVLGHGFFLSAFYFYGHALGIDLPVLAILVAIPAAQILAAIPGLPGGWGVGDLAFLTFLPETGVPAGTAVALSFTFRIFQTLLALPGGLWLFRHRGEVHVDEIERSMAGDG